MSTVIKNFTFCEVWEIEPASIVNALDLAGTSKRLATCPLEKKRIFTSAPEMMDAISSQMKQLKNVVVCVTTSHADGESVRNDVETPASNYPQPPDTELISVDTSFVETVEQDAVGSHVKDIRKKSVWKRTKKFATNCARFVNRRNCFS